MRCPQCFFSDDSPEDDACRRCSRHFTRVELVEVILIGLVLFILCRFSYYLFTGDFFDDLLKGGAFFPAASADALRFPVSIAEQPLHALTLGLLFAVIVLVPVLVALYYGPIPGVVLAVLCGWHVPAPFFFVASAAGAALAGVTMKRRLLPGLRVLAGAGVPVLYLLILVMPGASKTGASAWLVPAATVLSIAALAPVLMWQARRRDYAGRFLVPVTAALVLVVFVLFYGSVGFSEIEYAFVRAKYTVAGARFRLVAGAATDPAEREAEHEKALAECERRREGALNAFTKFINWFPRTAETPLARFERAEVANIEPRFTHTRPDQLVVYTDRITEDALADYGIIREEFVTSPAALVARLHIARYFLQHSQHPDAGEFPPLGKALWELDLLAQHCAVRLPDRYVPPAGEGVIDRWRTHRLTDEEQLKLYHEVLVESDAEQRFVQANSDYNRIPLMLYYQVDPNADGCEAEYRRILDWFPGCKLADNVRLALLLRRAGSLADLETLLDEFPDGDAAARILAMLVSGYRERKDAARADAFRERLEKGDSPQKRGEKGDGEKGDSPQKRGQSPFSPSPFSSEAQGVTP